MARSKIRKDSHGLYVVAGGYVFRPDYPVGYKHLEKDLGYFKEDEVVNANHRGGSPLANIKRIGEKSAATWYSHGAATYWDAASNKSKRCDSETVYRPGYEYWD